MDAAIGYVVAHGDPVDRARLSWLRSGLPPAPELIDRAEAGATHRGGWPAIWAGEVPSIDATCFRLAELDDLGALDRPAARAALNWLAWCQQPDGGWEEDASLAGNAPDWARPGDPDARLYLTASAGFWLAVTGQEALAGGVYAEAANRAAHLLATRLITADGTWSSYLVTAGLSAAVLYRRSMFRESARLQAILDDRLPRMSPADVAWMAAVLRRAGVADNDWTLVLARRRLAETQRRDGGWDSDDGHQFDVHTTLTVIRACR